MEDLVSPNEGFWSGLPVLVTGHSGFKGAWLSLWLSKLGAKVTGFALPPETDPSLFSLGVRSKDVTTHFGDIRDQNALAECVNLTQPKIVFHLAAQSLVRPSYRDPVGTYATNVMGTVHLLEAVRAQDSVQAVVVVTSDKCYDNREWHWSYRENEPIGGHDPYSNSKGCAELVTSAYRKSFFGAADDRRCHIATARAGNVIGGGDWSSDRLVPDIIRSFGAGKSTEIRSPNAVRPWQHVLEPLAGYIRLAECLAGPDGMRFAEPWNFGPADEDCRPVSYIVDRLSTRWGEGAQWHLSEKLHPHEASLLKVDSSKACARLGWARRLRLDMALDWTTDWYRRQLKGEDAAQITNEQIDRYHALKGL